MCPSFNSFGSLPSVSQLVWDTDLVIPDGKAIESASGEVGIVGDVSISGTLNTAKITGAVYPCTIASDTGTATTVLKCPTPNNGGLSPVCWGYNGAFTVTGPKEATAYGVDLQTGKWTSQNLANTSDINMFIAYLETAYSLGEFTMSMLSPRNAIL